MATYCGTADCLLISRVWTDLVLDGTTNHASDYLTGASEWIDARIGDWHQPVSPLAASGTVYDYWVKKAAANYAVYMAFDSTENEKYASGDVRYYDRYKTEAEKIMDDLRARVSTITEDTAVWERGIAPARGVENGPVAAPYTGILISNAEHGGVYTGELERTLLVRLDGTGTTIHVQTFAWQYKGGTDWKQSGITIQPDSWHFLEYGVAVSFLTQAAATVAVGQTWEIPCFPARGGNYGGKGLRSWDVQIG